MTYYLLLLTCHLDTNYFAATKDFLLALGERHIHNHFPTADYLSAAVDHKWQEIASSIASSIELDDGINGARILASRASRTKYDFIFCTTYDDITATVKYLKDKSVSHHVTYSSASKNRVCSQAYLTLREIHYFHNSSIAFTLLTPVPTVLKLENSVHNVLSWLSNSSTWTVATH